jgi:hypothetical protein
MNIRNKISNRCQHVLNTHNSTGSRSCACTHIRIRTFICKRPRTGTGTGTEKNY